MSVSEVTAVSGMIADLMNQSMAFLTLYLSVVSGYLVVAFVVGNSLSRFQATLITCFFVIFSIHFTVSAYGSFELAYLQHMKYLEYIPDAKLGPTPWINRPLAFFQLAGIIGCLKFMWDVRSGKDS